MEPNGSSRRTIALYGGDSAASGFIPGGEISWSAAGPRRRFEGGVSLARSAGKPRSTSDRLPVAIYTFDMAPARLMTGLITERGVLQADRDMLTSAFPERPRTAEAPPSDRKFVFGHPPTADKTFFLSIKLGSFCQKS